jgi:methylated-DNA-[protein]-cysteine S-methyltransferase
MTSGSTQTARRRPASVPPPAEPVRYAVLASPLGLLLAAATQHGLVRLAYVDGDGHGAESVVRDLAERVSPDLVERPPAFDGLRRELDEYFAGRRDAFDLPLDWSLTSGFRRAVLVATAGIPYGRTETYRSVATTAGNPAAVRAAGTALATNPIPIVVPCHRVLRTDGGLGGYRGGLELKRALLRLEAAGRERA